MLTSVHRFCFWAIGYTGKCNLWPKNILCPGRSPGPRRGAPCQMRALRAARKARMHARVRHVMPKCARRCDAKRARDARRMVSQAFNLCQSLALLPVSERRYGANRGKCDNIVKNSVVAFKQFIRCFFESYSFPLYSHWLLSALMLNYIRIRRRP